MEQWIGKLLIAFRTLQRFLDGHVADVSLTKEQRQNKYLADVAQENAERLARNETALDPNTPEKPRKVELTAQVNNHGTHNVPFLHREWISQLKPCETLRTVSRRIVLCAEIIDGKTPSLRVSGHVMNRTFILEDFAERRIWTLGQR